MKKKKAKKQEVVRIARRMMVNYEEAYRRLYVRPSVGKPSLKMCPDPLIAVASDLTLLMDFLYKDGRKLLR